MSILPLNLVFACAMRVKVEKELDQLVKSDTITPVPLSDWATPIVLVLKKDRNIRICGDFRVIINEVSKLEQYPIPQVEDLLSTLAGGKNFTKLDIIEAYQQLCLDEESQTLVVIDTHKGLFKYKCLPIGVSSAPAIPSLSPENQVEKEETLYLKQVI